MKASGLLLWVRSWFVEQKDLALLILTLTTLECLFIDVLYCSRLILLYSNHMEGRKTADNHLVHTAISLY